MIGHLRGTLYEIDEEYLVVDVGGVGYQVKAATSLLNSLPARGEDIFIYTHTHIRDDGATLFGFRDPEQVRLFRMLLKVTGIGPGAALAVISTLPVEEIRAAINEGDVDTLCRVNGVGRKTAQRLVFELKGELPLLDVASKDEPVFSELYAALEALGYTRQEARNAVKKAELATIETGDVSVLLREVLKTMGKK